MASQSSDNRGVQANAHTPSRSSGRQRLILCPDKQRKNRAGLLGPEITKNMTTFKLRGSPKRKNYRPVRVTTSESFPMNSTPQNVRSIGSLSSEPQQQLFSPPSSMADQIFQDTLAIISRTYPQLSFKTFMLSGVKWCVVHGSPSINNKFQTPMYNPRMVIKQQNGSFTFSFEVNLYPQHIGCLPRDREHFYSLLTSLVPSSNYRLCSGLPEDVCTQSSINSKSVRKWGLPFKRYDHKECLLWFVCGSSESSRCPKCTNLSYYMRRQNKKKQLLSPSRKLKRTLPSSRCPYKYLSPASIKKRIHNISEERKSFQKKFERLHSLDVELKDDSDASLIEATSYIQKNSKSELEALLLEADAAGKGDVLRQTWKQDVEDRLNFNKDQHSNVTGKKSNRWSLITIRMALAIYTRSPAAYKAFASFNLFQLPSTNTLKMYVRSNAEAAGEVEQRLVSERKKYDARVLVHQSSGSSKPPLCQGALIFDEVKVAAKLHWNSRDDKIVGHAMTAEEMSSLHDIYTLLDEDPGVEKADYVLQTMWRDLTSDCDIVGPHYTTKGTFEAKFMLACVHDALRKFEAHGFGVCVLVCDGAASNLTALKVLLGVKGSFGTNDKLQDKHEVPTTCTNPFSGKRLHLLICPSHQLKNMIAALDHSRLDNSAANKFVYGVTQFGWEPIEGMLVREAQRKMRNELPRVPGLRESYVYRDAWTRLNVAPAKIMQQEHVLSELREYATSNPVPNDSASVLKTVQYLTACNQMFERGILGKKVFIRSPVIDNPIIKSMDEGFLYFKSWADERLNQGYRLTEQSSRQFLVWQTWDLLRVMYYGFKKFATDFLSENPQYIIYPVRLNGSAVETFFSQMKHATSSQLSGVNYSSAKGTLLTRGTLHGRKKGKKGYRSAALFIRQHPLKRLNYGKK